jgi:ribosomal protein L28
MSRAGVASGKRVQDQYLFNHANNKTCRRFRPTCTALWPASENRWVKLFPARVCTTDKNGIDSVLTELLPRSAEKV